MLRTSPELSMTKPLLALAMFLCIAIPACSQDLNARLTAASRTSDTAEVRKLLAEGANPNAMDKNGRTPLMEASSGGYTDTVRVLLEKGADVNAKDMVGWTALFWAAFSRRTETVRALLDRGADAEARDNEGRTALFWTASSGYTDTVRVLLAKGANVNAKDNHGWTPLMSAANLGHLETARALLDKHADVHVRDKDGNTAQSLAEKYRFSNIATLLQNAAEAPQDKRSKDKIAIVPAEPSANSAAVSAPLPDPKKGAASLSVPVASPTTPVPSKSETLNQELLHAADAGDTVEVLSLIREGAGVNARDATYGNTAMMRAAGRGYSDTARALIEKGGEVDGTDNSGHTALMVAAFGGYTNTVRLLVEKGADVNARDTDGWTPLFWAVFSRRTDVVRFLLEKGAGANAKNKHDDTPLIHAAYGGDVDTLAVLLEHHPDLNAKNDMGRTALIEAVRQEHPEAVRLLLEGGAAADIQDQEGSTALSLATKQASSSIVALLKNPPRETKGSDAGSAPANPPVSQPAAAPDARPANVSAPDPLAAEMQELQKRTRARKFYGLGLSMSFLEEWWPQSGEQAERAAATVLGDLRNVGAPEDLIELAQQTATRLAFPSDDNKSPLLPLITDLRKRLDTFGLAQTEEKFFYTAGGFTYELDLLGRHLSTPDHGEASIEENRLKLLSVATNLGAKCALIAECKGRALSYFSDAVTLLQKSPLAVEDGTSLQKLSDEIGVALGTENR
jgi:ankyrin repeat protein